MTEEVTTQSSGAAASEKGASGAAAGEKGASGAAAAASKGKPVAFEGGKFGDFTITSGNANSVTINGNNVAVDGCEVKCSHGKKGKIKAAERTTTIGEKKIACEGDTVVIDCSDCVEKKLGSNAVKLYWS